ncbi:MAG: hypothetical protein BVN29_12280 [Nitrospira sp. ST-bin5]|nr:MAG: hypothetical protein BVN29_12280 [Nitrospira sp. ST-bin5]
MPDGVRLVRLIVQIGSLLRIKAGLRLTIVWLALFFVIPPLIQAGEIHLESIGLRGGGERQLSHRKEGDAILQ